MNYKTILITGGCGFVGSNLAEKIHDTYPGTTVIALDNYYRAGSELNKTRLEKKGIKVVKGDVRNMDDLNFSEKIDLIIECAAEPSVLAGLNESPRYLIDTNLNGVINCLEVARKHSAAFIFLSTSRVYPVKELNALQLEEAPTRFEISKNQSLEGVSEHGINENFGTGSARTLYGTTKLAAELFVSEYAEVYKVPAIINRCGVITGPWQFGKVDQGVIALWVGRHTFKSGKLSYIGFGGVGKQVRDYIFIDDLFKAIQLEMEHFGKYAGQTFNIGGGRECSVSLQELTQICQKVTGNTIDIEKSTEDRPGDIPLYITDSRKFAKLSGWKPTTMPEEAVKSIHEWMLANADALKKVLG